MSNVNNSPNSPDKTTPNRKRSYSPFHNSPSKMRLINKRFMVKRDLNLELMLCVNSSVTLSEAIADLDENSVSLLKNIHDILENESLRCLLDGKTQNILNICFKLVKPGIMVVRELFWVKNIWHRQAQVEALLKNTKIVNEPAEVIKSLVDSGMLVRDISDLTEEDLSNLKQADLNTICKILNIKSKNKVKAILNYSQQKPMTAFTNVSSGKANNIQRVHKIIEEKFGYSYKLSDSVRDALKKLYILMYLGTPFEWISKGLLDQVLLNDKAERETYPIDKSMTLDNASVVFRSEHEFTNYLNSFHMHEKYDQASEENITTVLSEVFDLYKNISQTDMTRYQSLPVWLRQFTPAYHYVTILEDGIETLNKLQKYDLALEVLTTLVKQTTVNQHNKAKWYKQMATIYGKTKNPEKAAEILLEALESDMSNEHKDVLRKPANKIADQRNINIDEEIRTRLKTLASDGQILENSFPATHVTKQPLQKNGNPHSKVLFAVENSTVTLDAEFYTIWHYKKEKAFDDGAHWEGNLVTTLFFLLFWDIIYTKPQNVSGIFLSYYQKYPLDIHDENFYINRKKIIDERIKQIENDDVENLVNEMQKVLAERPRHEVADMYGELKWKRVRDAVRVLGARRVAALCARVATTGLRARAGFPDLTLWSRRQPHVLFVEVKTDSDRPFVKQLRWMDYLRNNDINVEFCYIGVKTDSCKERAAKAKP